MSSAVSLSVLLAVSESVSELLSLLSELFPTSTSSPIRSDCSISLVKYRACCAST